MPGKRAREAAEGDTPRRLFVYNGGFLTQPRLRRILRLAGYKVTLGKPGPGDLVGVWGQSPYAHRGEVVSEKTETPLLRVEDAFLRSLHPGRDGEPPVGLMIDQTGVHFDGRSPSDLETLLATHPLDDGALLSRARAAMAWMMDAQLTKYSGIDPATPCPDPGYVLVIDQTKGDASVTASGAGRARFLEMLTFARQDHPGARIVIKTHPETVAGHRAGHFRAEDAGGNVTLLEDPVSPWALLQGATAVYTVSSQMGFEAILAGHKPHVYGQPFYAGWGLTVDDMPIARRTRQLTRSQLFAGAMMLYPLWFDPYRDRLCELEDVLAALDSQARAWREDRRGWVAHDMRMWKRKPLQGFFGTVKPVLFSGDAPDRRHMVWAARAAPDSPFLRVEDGFLRSRGLGADLVPPLSLVCDPEGIYYDPTRPSRLERLIVDSPGLRPDQLDRARRLSRRLVRDGLSKYNLGGTVPQLPAGHRILVPGQVEDDASIRLGTDRIATNAALLETARAANPDATILYKPHPDVVAGLRPGTIERPEQWADRVLDGGDIGQLLQAVDEVWTMTSLTGFEALLRGCRVVTVGMPFYAGWGLTRDLMPRPDRRRVHGVTLEGLTFATLIAYPRYRDPVTGLPCPVEVVAERLASGQVPRPGPLNRSLSKVQGLFASQAHWWRR
ncbi:capsular polysaccharide biosynthesis protein [Mesobacterium sp. TK19101]|uniref:Capsular polysaccharide biosynthesis protein n=1 Tax=Mesobacterium hydrothermale TaxID=3111907 RepID=A0ABU6HCR4_9RHOB|nr:capsular polysaccharide biosynthesis protein [Mesobacterium sp. TK19101]MEC3860257.1 capsular polysaccharide biosynthesis protein [Mesobacterium sp. TK19101]